MKKDVTPKEELLALTEKVIKELLAIPEEKFSSHDAKMYLIGIIYLMTQVVVSVKVLEARIEIIEVEFTKLN